MQENPNVNFSALSSGSIFEEKQPILNRMASFAPKKAQPIIVIFLVLLLIPVVFGLPIIYMAVLAALYKTNILYGLLATIPIAAGLIFLYKRQRRVEKKTKQGIRSFALDNGWKYGPANNLIRSFNHGKDASSALSNGAVLYSIKGEYLGKEFELLVGWKEKGSRTLEPLTPQLFVATDKTLPDSVLISRHATDGSGIFDNMFLSYQNPMKISLEGNFDQYFQLYAPSDTQIDALSMVAPDFMQAAIDHIEIFSIITSGNTFSLLPRTTEEPSRQLIEKMFSAASRLIREVN